MYWAFLLAFGLGLVSSFIIIFLFLDFCSSFYFLFLVFFHGFINQYGERTEKGTGYWFFRSDRDLIDDQTGDVINNIINKILNYIIKNIISLLLII